MWFPVLVPTILVILAINVSGKATRRGKSCDCVCGVGTRKERIVGGTTAEEHEFPWIASLTLNGTFYCGASLLTRRHLLTAAHCLYGKRHTDITVGLGDHDRGDKDKPGKQVNLKLKRATMHEGFSLVKIQHDIGIVELEEPVKLVGPFIRTACLPSLPNANYSGLHGIVAGWGKTKERDPTSLVLRKVTLPLLTREECSTGYGYSSKKIFDTNFCAGAPNGMKDACQGDSGGPLHLNYTSPANHMELIGIVSWGRGCGRPRYPGVYTRVDKYESWIKKQIGDECMCDPPTKN